ncbi:MAG: chalcone isomerase family protein [Proteobacteria bacterium]|nr:chalcone isomerase family protein [Pseudomonadota bacterium]
MKRLLLALLLLAMAPLHAAEVAGVKVEETTRSGAATLALNGAGLRTKAFFKVYVLGLYLPEKKAAAADVLASNGPKRVLIQMLRDVDADDFSEALEAGIKDNHSEADFKGLASRMAALNAVMAEIKEAKKGMAIALDWVPGTGTQVVIDSQPRGKPIPGDDFYRALLRIWIGDKPVSGDLKKALLGQAG